MLKSESFVRFALRETSVHNRRSMRSAGQRSRPPGPVIANPSDEHRRRLVLLQSMYLTYAAENPEPDGVIHYGSTLPPRWWINDRLTASGEAWRVGVIEGLTCEAVDVLRN
jgi:hypothetical protein